MFTIDIEKSKIIEIWDNNQNKVIKYTQLVKDKQSDLSKEIIAKDLTDLMVKVREQIYDWKYLGETDET